MPTSSTIARTADLNAAIQTIDLAGASSAPNRAYTIGVSSFTLDSQLYAVNLDAGDTLATQGNGFALDGGGRYNGFFDYTGAVSIGALAIDHAKAVGGTGSSAGGGARLRECLDLFTAPDDAAGHG